MKAKFNHHLPQRPNGRGTQVFVPMISGEDFANLTPANHLWQPPDDFPEHYRKQLAGELDVPSISWGRTRRMNGQSKSRGQ